MVHILSNSSRKENGEVKLRMQEQDDVILGLRRDLAGASARLSDITGTQFKYFLCFGQHNHTLKWLQLYSLCTLSVIFL